LQQWTQFTTKDGLGDDTATAVACDKQGRIWVGHSANHGVSVFNGQKWQNYCNVAIPGSASSLLGPLGARVSHITVCPTDSDIWIATDCGLTRYSDSRDTWSYIAPPTGEPTSLAFDKPGNIYVGTAHDGIAMAKVAGNCKKWREVKAPDEAPSAPPGSGLPSNSINGILVASDGTIYAATDTGVAWSKDSGVNWQYVRFFDGGTGVAPSQQPALSEDYCTCLAEGMAGRVLVGHRQAGVNVFEPALHRATVITNPIFATAIINSGRIYVGTSEYSPHRIAYPGPGGVVAPDAPVDGAGIMVLARGDRIFSLPSAAPPVALTELPPEIGMRNLGDFYEAGLLGQVVKLSGLAADDPRYSAWKVQILFLQWLTQRNLGNAAESDHLRESFLKLYPRQTLAPAMYLESAFQFLADGRYQAADDRLAMIEEYFPDSSAVIEVKGLRGQIRASIEATAP
jgi:hypothetical protein